METQPKSNGQLIAKLVSTALAIITMLGLLAIPGKATATYTIDVTDYYGSVAVTGRGYSHDGASTLTFNTAANGNDYVIKRDSGFSKEYRVPGGCFPKFRYI